VFWCTNTAGHIIINMIVDICNDQWKPCHYDSPYLIHRIKAFNTSKQDCTIITVCKHIS